MLTERNPIGLFDSGIGGLSVARHIHDVLPGEDYVYFGDSARVPYGSKSTSTVRLYTREAVRFLESKEVKLIIVACNTASAVALDFAQSLTSVPVIGVIESGAAEAVEVTKNGRIGVIGTEGTVRSEAYRRAIESSRPGCTVFSRACPLFVGCAEEGMIEHAATRLIAEEYLRPLLDNDVDTIVMGCTHYPILRPTIAEICGPDVQLIDPGKATAHHALQILEERGLRNQSDMSFGQSYRYFLSDFPHKFIEIGERFLGRSIADIQKVDLEELHGC